MTSIKTQGDLTMKLCMVCGTPTEGSVGAAGIKYSMVCQLCKDEADNELRTTLAANAKIVKSMMDTILSTVSNPKGK
jgi:hypothetical protein